MNGSKVSLILLLAAMGCGSGAAGKDGAAGADGADGANGDDGIDCWDTNGNGEADEDEDANGDGEINAADCAGADGEDGVSGADGEDGVPGADGEDGAPGADGEDGAPGADGEDGEDGAPGADGEDGAPGADGEDGAPGADGDDAHETLIESERVFEDMYGCGHGFEVVSFGVDDGTDGIADDGVLQDGEIHTESTFCLTPDIDDDGHTNLDDNCPEDANPDQVDRDFDGIGTVCDPEEEESAGPSGSLYLVTEGSGSGESDPSHLYWTEDPTEEAVYVGSVGYALNSIKVNPVDGLLYGIERGRPSEGQARMILIDTATGAGSPVTGPIVQIGDTPGSDGPYSSIAFLSDGTPVGWSESGDIFVRMDLDAETATETGVPMSSGPQGMCVSSDDEIYFVNMGEVYVFPSDTGYAGDSPAADFTADLKGGDCDRETGVMYIIDHDDADLMWRTVTLFYASEYGVAGMTAGLMLPATDYGDFLSVALVP